MLFILLAYVALMLTAGLHRSKKIDGFREYVLAGGRQGAGVITFSLLASMVGGSATLGIAKMAADIGFPAFWWLGAGVLGLLLQAFLLSDKVRSFNACTLPDIAAITVGKEAKILTALIIAITWIGIVAAQFSALAQIFSVIAGIPDPRWLLILFSLVVILYTAAGGQTSVLRTDSVQFFLLAGGVALSCVFLWGKDTLDPLSLTHLEWINARFGYTDLVSLLLLVGSSFFIGPDIFSRNLAARNGATARRATFLAAGGLLIFAVLITLIGMWAGSHGLGKLSGENPLVILIREYLPLPLAMLLALGLISALMSSADTCLLTTAAILEHDLLQKSSLLRTRIFVILVGLLSLGVALLKSDIIGLLLSAYSVYAPGIVMPLFVAIFFHGTRKVHRPLWLTGVTVGGLCGLFAGIVHIPSLSLLGMAFSAVLAIGSVLWQDGTSKSFLGES